MFAKCRVYDTAIKQYLRSIGYVVKGSQRFVELIVVVVGQRADPSLDFLSTLVNLGSTASPVPLFRKVTYLLQRHDCSRSLLLPD
jgi:hypothetical protein